MSSISLIYYEDSKPSDARSNCFSAVKPCLNAYFDVVRRYGKGPCFSAYGFLNILDPDYSLSISYGLYGRFFHD